MIENEFGEIDIDSELVARKEVGGLGALQPRRLGAARRPASPRLVSLPPAWVGQLATDYIKTYNDTNPFFLKVSFHRPHSPYDPPARVYNETTTVFPPMALGNDWDRVFTGASGLGDNQAYGSS